MRQPLRRNADQVDRPGITAGANPQENVLKTILRGALHVSSLFCVTKKSTRRKSTSDCTGETQSAVSLRTARVLAQELNASTAFIQMVVAITDADEAFCDALVGRTFADL